MKNLLSKDDSCVNLIISVLIITYYVVEAHDQKENKAQMLLLTKTIS